MPAATRFPQELVDAVLDALRDEKPTLCHCSLVCKSWSYRARRHLFHTLHLDAFSIPQKPHAEWPNDIEIPDWQRVATELKMMPTVSAFVQELEIVGPGFAVEIETVADMGELFFDFSSEGEAVTPWGTNYVVLRLEALYEICQALPNLSCVSLVSLVLEPDTAPHFACQPKCLRSLSINYVGMFTLGRDGLDIFHFLKPEEVSINTYFMVVDGHSLRQPAPTRTQRGLTATKWRIKGDPDVHTILWGLLNTPFTSHVTSLNIAIGFNEELKALIALLDAMANLKSLELDICDTGFWRTTSSQELQMYPETKKIWTHSSLAALGRCVGLECFGLAFISQTPFEDLSLLLDALPSTITKVSLAIDFASLNETYANTLPWGVLSSVLQRKKGLREITVGLKEIAVRGIEGSIIDNNVQAGITEVIASRFTPHKDILNVVFYSRGD